MVETVKGVVERGAVKSTVELECLRGCSQSAPSWPVATSA